MKATTHTEIYRPFEGELHASPFRFLTIGWSGIRHGFKRKVPLAILLAIPAIYGVVSSVFVYLKFTVQSGSMGEEAQNFAVIATLAGQLSDVAGTITDYVINVRTFALLATTWYGAGLIAEDRRVGAHLLYFSRPITRIDYFLGKFTVAAFYGALAFLAPAMLICFTAAFSSPNWSFLTQKWQVIAQTIGYCLIWIATMALIVLAVSSLVQRKTWALVGVFAVLLLTQAMSGILVELTDDGRWELLNIFSVFERIADGLFDKNSGLEISLGSAYATAGAWIAVSMAVLAQRLRRMEVVA